MIATSKQAGNEAIYESFIEPGQQFPPDIAIVKFTTGGVLRHGAPVKLIGEEDPSPMPGERNKIFSWDRLTFLSEFTNTNKVFRMDVG